MEIIIIEEAEPFFPLECCDYDYYNEYLPFPPLPEPEDEG